MVSMWEKGLLTSVKAFWGQGVPGEATAARSPQSRSLEAAAALEGVNDPEAVETHSVPEVPCMSRVTPRARPTCSDRLSHWGPTNAIGHYDFGMAYQAKNRMVDAWAEYRQAVAQTPRWSPQYRRSHFEYGA
jgi:hypothetical protein